MSWVVLDRVTFLNDSHHSWHRVSFWYMTSQVRSHSITLQHGLRILRWWEGHAILTTEIRTCSLFTVMTSLPLLPVFFCSFLVYFLGCGATIDWQQVWLWAKEGHLEWESRAACSEPEYPFHGNPCQNWPQHWYSGRRLLSYLVNILLQSVCMINVDLLSNCCCVNQLVRLLVLRRSF